MPQFCNVLNCSMRSERDPVRFFRIPAALKNRGEYLDALSKQRRESWITALNRGPLSVSMLKNGRICSRHFISGQPAPLQDTNDPDWIPTQNMGYIMLEKKVNNLLEDMKKVRGQ